MYGDNGGHVIVHEEGAPGGLSGKLTINHVGYRGASPGVTTQLTQLYSALVLDPSIVNQRLPRIAAVLAEGYSSRQDDLLHVAVVTEEFAGSRVTGHAVHLLSFIYGQGPFTQPIVRKLASFPAGVWPGKPSLAIGLVADKFQRGVATDYSVVVVAGNTTERTAWVATVAHRIRAGNIARFELPS